MHPLVGSMLAVYSLNGDLQMLCIVYILVPTLLYTNHCLGSPLSNSEFSLKTFQDISDMENRVICDWLK